MDKRVINTISACWVLLLFILITYPNMINHVPFKDEIQNYMVSYFMTPDNFIDALQFHGHALLWYLLIMPFAKTGYFYPYDMMLINYIFLLAALIVLWAKAPFNNYIKITITFSYMFITYFAIYARPYTIGILGLFLMAALYKDQLKKPVLYSIITGLTVNTSAIAAITASGLMLPFLYSLLKNREKLNSKSVIISVVILAAFLVFSIIPHYTLCYAEQASLEQFWRASLSDFFNSIPFSVSYFFVFLFLVFSSIYNKKWNEVFFLIFVPAAMWIFFLLVYTCSFYHRYFLLIHIIIAMWLQYKDGIFYKPGFKRIVFYVFFTIMLVSSHGRIVEGHFQLYEYGKLIKNDETKYTDASIIFTGDLLILYDFTPFLAYKKGTDIYHYSSKYGYKMFFAPEPLGDIKEFIKDKKHVYIFSDRELKDPLNTDYEEIRKIPAAQDAYMQPYKPANDDKYFYAHPENTPLYVYKLK